MTLSIMRDRETEGTPCDSGHVLNKPRRTLEQALADIAATRALIREVEERNAARRDIERKERIDG